jgi:hypothetical protein
VSWVRLVAALLVLEFSFACIPAHMVAASMNEEFTQHFLVEDASPPNLNWRDEEGKNAKHIRDLGWLGGMVGCRNLRALLEAHSTAEDGPILESIPDLLKQMQITMPGYATIELVPDPKLGASVNAHGFVQARRHADGWIIASGSFSANNSGVVLSDLVDKRPDEQFVDLPVSISMQINDSPDWWWPNNQIVSVIHNYYEIVRIERDRSSLETELKLFDVLPVKQFSSPEEIVREITKLNADWKIISDDLRKYEESRQFSHALSIRDFLVELDDNCREMFEKDLDDPAKPRRHELDPGSTIDLWYRIFLDFSRNGKYARIRYERRDGDRKGNNRQCHEIYLAKAGREAGKDPYVGCLYFYEKDGRYFPVKGGRIIKREPRWSTND